MDDLKPYAVFAETVAAGSMSAAARRLGISPSAVSQIIRQLEQQAGVMLLHRSTRKLALTEAGERCYPHCRLLLEAARAAESALAQARDAPSGELRVAAPVGFAAHIALALSPLLALAPQLLLSLAVDDAFTDLIDGRIDIAIRVGTLPDSAWVARPLCHAEMVLCAAPAYLSRRGMPASPHVLPDHHWLAYERDALATGKGSAGAEPQGLPAMTLDLLHSTEPAQQVQVPVRIASNNHLSLQQMCEQGLGIARLGYADVLPAMTRGTLVHVLPQWYFSPVAVSALTPRRAGEPVKVRAALDALQHYFGVVLNSAPDRSGLASTAPRA